MVQPVLWCEHAVEERVEELKVREEAVDANVPKEVVLVANRAGEPGCLGVGGVGWGRWGRGWGGVGGGGSRGEVAGGGSGGR